MGQSSVGRLRGQTRQAGDRMEYKLILILGAVASATGQLVDDFTCPDEFVGFYPHLISCDKYWHCQNGYADLKTCGNGLGFLDSLTTRKAEDVAGLTKCPSAAAMSLLLMMKDQNLSVQDRQQQEFSLSMLILQIVGSTSCVLVECLESMDVLWELSSMLDQELELMGNVLIQRKFQSVLIIMEILSLMPESFLKMDSTPEDRITLRE